MNILYVGDVMGEVGLEVVERVLPRLRAERQITVVLAQAENLSEGRGVRVADFARLRKAGVDFCTGGNWTLHRDEIYPALSDPAQPIVRPANYPAGTAGLEYKYLSTPSGKILVVSLLGQIVGKDAEKPVNNPLQTIDRILEAEHAVPKAATIVNFHGDFSSEKRIIGYYLDGRAALAIGDHWHVPTADADVLPGGTAHQTDVGMCGSLDSSLGVQLKLVITRWRDGHPTRNVLETGGRRQFNALLVAVDPATGRAQSAERIQQIY
ncbi:MAG TPA: TIGR00282 family metallophosphoesterase [Candidatus Saccharimonadales bacterium]|nr:TIGR00282 family metallophosphoesterase [Candidatus Saccharimonadales bacterium]